MLTVAPKLLPFWTIAEPLPSTNHNLLTLETHRTSTGWEGYVLLPLRAAKARDVVLAPLPATIVLEAEPWRDNTPHCYQLLCWRPSLMAVTVVSEVIRS